MEERRHEVQVGDPVALDEVQGTGRLEPRLADEPARDERHREQRAHSHGVVERHHPQGALAVAVAVLRDVRDGAGALGRVGSRNPLRAPRGAGGVEHDRDVVRTGPWCRIRGGTAREVVEPDGAAARAARRDSRDLAGVRRIRHRIRRHRLEAHRPRAGVVEHVVQLLGLRAPVHRRDRHARELAGPVQGRGLEPVLEDGDEMVAAAESERVEPRHRAQRAIQPGAVGQRRLAVDDRDGGGLAFGDVEEGAAEVEHAGPLSRPVAPPSVAPRRAPRRRWGHSRCTGTGARRAPRGRGLRRARARAPADR